MTARSYAGDWQVLVDPTRVQAISADATIVDIRPAPSFAEGHIPGALNAPYPAWIGTGGNPGAVPEAEQLNTLLQDLGLTQGSAVVLTYPGESATGFGGAARVYWTLKSAGLTRIAILNGGQLAWAEAGLPVALETRTLPPTDAEFQLSYDWRITEPEILDALYGNTDVAMIDARPFEFLEGMNQHQAALEAGTIPGAVNLEHSIWFEPTASGGTRISPQNASDRLAVLPEVLGAPATGIAMFCNVGRWSATNWFMLSEVVGIPNVRLYPEGMVGWTKAGRETVVME